MLRRIDRANDVLSGLSVTPVNARQGYFNEAAIQLTLLHEYPSILHRQALTFWNLQEYFLSTY
jgi:hypothetical protein